QVTRPVPTDGLSGPSPKPFLDAALVKGSDYEEEITLTKRLLFQPVKGIRRWTRQLLEQLVQERKLEKKDLRREALWLWEADSLPRTSRGKVASALCDYLSQSGEHAYNLNWERSDRDVADPTEDFLCNGRRGHRELCVSGLNLRLRS